jgi:hypothetical protein
LPIVAGSSLEEQIACRCTARKISDYIRQKNLS